MTGKSCLDLFIFSIKETTQLESESLKLEMQALEYHTRALATPKGITELEKQLSNMYLNYSYEKIEKFLNKNDFIHLKILLPNLNHSIQIQFFLLLSNCYEIGCLYSSG